jgi:Na+-transporting NADH:ubiquinone oxidoreductase subunit NqrB
MVLTTSLWQTILTCIAIKGKNTMQVVAVTIFNYAFLGYAVMMVCPPFLLSKPSDVVDIRTTQDPR